jgi:hypothetical protein
MAFIAEGNGLELIPEKLDLISIVTTIDVTRCEITQSLKRLLSLALMQAPSEVAIAKLRHLAYWYNLTLEQILAAYPATGFEFWTKVFSIENLYLVKTFDIKHKNIWPKEMFSNVLPSLLNQGKSELFLALTEMFEHKIYVIDLLESGFVCLDKLERDSQFDMKKTNSTLISQLEHWRKINLSTPYKKNEEHSISSGTANMFNFDLKQPAFMVPAPEEIDRIKNSLMVEKCSSGGKIGYRLFRNGLMVMPALSAADLYELKILRFICRISDEAYHGVISCYAV